MTRRTLALLTIGVLIAGCGGPKTESADGPKTTMNRVTPSSSSATPTTADPEPPEPTMDVCALVEAPNLELAFPAGVPEPTVGQSNRGVSCQWGTAAANLTVTLWPGDEFYSSCDTCEPLAFGDDGWIDGSASFWTALVVSGDTTVQLIAAGLGMEQDSFTSLVATVVDNI